MCRPLPIEKPREIRQHMTTKVCAVAALRAIAAITVATCIICVVVVSYLRTLAAYPKMNVVSEFVAVWARLVSLQ